MSEFHIMIKIANTNPIMSNPVQIVLIGQGFEWDMISCLMTNKS